MKKFAACAVCILLVVLLVFHFAGEDDFAADNLTRVNEASFDLFADSGSSDATGFLVGCFTAGDGSRLSFNGTGGVTLTGADGSARSGDYALVQYEDYSAVLRIRFPEDSTAYTFRLVTAGGSFSLTDGSGKAVTYEPTIS